MKVFPPTCDVAVAGKWENIENWPRNTAGRSRTPWRPLPTPWPTPMPVWPRPWSPPVRPDRQTLNEIRFKDHYQLNPLVLFKGNKKIYSGLTFHPLSQGTPCCSRPLGPVPYSEQQAQTPVTGVCISSGRRDSAAPESGPGRVLAGHRPGPDRVFQHPPGRSADVRGPGHDHHRGLDRGRSLFFSGLDDRVSFGRADSFGNCL